MNNNLEDLKKELAFIHFKKFFLLEFTRQLIRNSALADIFKLETILEKENTVKFESTKDRIKEKIRVREEEISAKYDEEKAEGMRSIMHPSIGMFESQKTPEINPFKTTKMLPGPFITQTSSQTARTSQQMTQQRAVYYEDPFRKLGIWVSDANLPPHIQYLRPTPMNKDIDLGKINPLINDQMVRTIECYGQDENLVVKGAMGVKKTSIILGKEEVEDIIQRFSKETKIPVQEGVFKVVAGRLIFMAIISGLVGSKFVIKKMVPEQMNQGR
jgi:hypothetical protein